MNANAKTTPPAGVTAYWLRTEPGEDLDLSGPYTEAEARERLAAGAVMWPGQRLLAGPDPDHLAELPLATGKREREQGRDLILADLGWYTSEMGEPSPEEYQQIRHIAEAWAETEDQVLVLGPDGQQYDDDRLTDIMTEWVRDAREWQRDHEIPVRFTRGELEAIHAAAEIVVQTELDRPEEGAAEMLSTIMAKTGRLLAGPAPADQRPVWIVIHYPDVEASAAARITGVTVHSTAEDADDSMDSSWPSAQGYACQIDGPLVAEQQRPEVAEFEGSLPAGSTVDQYATRMMELIEADIAAALKGLPRIPPDVGSFSRLHDYRDANMYLPPVMGPVALDFGSDESNRLVNDVLDEVARRLAVKAAEFRDRPCEFETDPADPAIRVCKTHRPDFGLYGDEACARESGL